MELLAWLLQAYPHIPLTHPPGHAYDYPSDAFNAAGLVAHGQVQPWNRIDPGPYFPWSQVLQQVEAGLSPLPEPSTGVLLSLAALGFVLAGRRRIASPVSALRRPREVLASAVESSMVEDACRSSRQQTASS